MDAALRQDVEDALGPLDDVRATIGGDVCRAFHVRSGSTQAFVKTRAHSPPGLFEAEAHSLGRLREATSARVPKVLGFGPNFLALEHVERGEPSASNERSLGRAIAELHLTTAPTFGLERDGFIGPLPQCNQPCESFAEFYWTQRIERMAHLAALPPDLGSSVLSLDKRIEELLSDAEAPPALLHGDLWAGNAMFDTAGTPVLFDPACYFGHREIDLAMMRLFGGFSDDVLAGYDETFPRAGDHERRVGAFQLYPLLVHAALFGDAYYAQLADTVRAVARGSHV